MTKAERRAIASLSQPKGRRREGAFLAEGTKCVLDTLDHFTLRKLLVTEAWLQNHCLPEIPSDKITVTNRGEISEISSMTNVPDVMAVYELPEETNYDPSLPTREIVLALDCIQDPGNLGTIIRTADWMGITTIIASTDTVDCFNPKVIQATMGAISRVKVIYGELSDMLSKSHGCEVYGTFLGGTNIYSAELSSSGIIIMGNEGRGISDNVAAHVTRRLLIPSYPPERPTSESLNVATATAIVLSQFRSRLLK